MPSPRVRNALGPLLVPALLLALGSPGTSEPSPASAFSVRTLLRPEAYLAVRF